MSTIADSQSQVLRFTPSAYTLWAAVIVALATIFYDGLELMVQWWIQREEYSHGFLIPLIVGFMVWQKRDRLEQIRFTGSWAGVVIVALGLLLYLAGELSTLYTIVQYAFLVVAVGLVLSVVGWEAFKLIGIPLFILVFMVPLPNFLYNNLSASLQLISSAIGVYVIRLFDISVFLSGNVIDLGSYKLQVVDACSGLRYLFPLVTLGFIVACFYRASFWKRAAVVLSTVPITVLMNSFRIGVIGVLVEYWGQSMAEGFLHDFEGWIVFMACFGILFVEMWILTRVTGDRRSFRDVFAIEYPAPRPPGLVVQSRRVPTSFIVAAAITGLGLFPSMLLPERVEAIPARRDFGEFPLQLGVWNGERKAMESVYIDALKFTDYVMADYGTAQGEAVSFYVAYYESQRKGESAHSPRTCIPGGGWQITSLQQTPIADTKVAGFPLTVNRAEIQFENFRQLVYYWFQQRGRVITNEYLVKWFLFWDSLTRNRSDGALVRLTTSLREGEDWKQGDARLSTFARTVAPVLEVYVPD